MPDTDTSVDLLTDRILDTIDTCRYRPQRAALRVQFSLHKYAERTPTQATVFVNIVQPVLKLWDDADAYAGDPVYAVERWEDYVPPDSVTSWGRQRADDLRWDARQLVRQYLESLGGDQ
jgi:hypothetical protein